MKNFCQDQLPRVSRRIDLVEFVCSSSTKGNLPQLLLLSAEKDTPVLWRALSGLYRNCFHFFDAEAHLTVLSFYCSFLFVSGRIYVSIQYQL